MHKKKITDKENYVLTTYLSYNLLLYNKIIQLACTYVHVHANVIKSYFQHISIYAYNCIANK